MIIDAILINKDMIIGCIFNMYDRVYSKKIATKDPGSQRVARHGPGLSYLRLEVFQVELRQTLEPLVRERESA